jgi:ribonuclease R
VRIGEDGKIASISLRERFDAHRLIEEFMIQANVCAAETLEDKRSPLVYRIHDQPTEEKINSLGNFLPTIGLKWTRGETVTGSRFNKLLADVKGSENEHLVNEMVLRTQAQARYASENLGHFGLNLAKYAHFTSPIRRYSDLIVHRGLIRALGLGPDGMTDQDVVRPRRAGRTRHDDRAPLHGGRARGDGPLPLAIFMADRVGAIFEARIAGVTRSGLFVRIKENGADGFIPAARLSDEYWIYDEAHAALVAQRSGQRYEMGMDVDVKADGSHAPHRRPPLLHAVCAARTPQRPEAARARATQLPLRPPQPRPQTPDRRRRPPTWRSPLDPEGAGRRRQGQGQLRQEQKAQGQIGLSVRPLTRAPPLVQPSAHEPTLRSR